MKSVGGGRPNLTEQILPLPQQLEAGKGTFGLRRAITLILPPAADDDDRFAAHRVRQALDAGRTQTVLEQRYDLTPPVPAIILARADRDQAFLGRCELAVPELKPQGYLLRVEPGRVLLVGADSAGLFYASCSLLQMLAGAPDLPVCEIVDYPRLAVRGVMHDVSRGKVAKLDTLFGLVDDLVAAKVNMLQLYTEHTFTFRKHPKIGLGAGALTPEDMIRLDGYCRQRHVTLVPNLSAFGHLHPILSLKEYRGLAEDEERAWCLNPCDDRSYELLDDLLSELLPNFTAPLFNANCDETYGLGEGKSKPLADEIGVGRVYLRHIQRLREIVTEKYGRRMMMWGDIILKYPDLIPELPEDIIVLDWHYEAERDWTLSKRFADAGRSFYVCPGTSSWNALFPRLGLSRQNIRKHVSAGIQYGAEGMLNTDWGDGGHDNLLGYSLYGFALGGQVAWNPETGDEQFEQAYAQVTYGTKGGDVSRALRLLDEGDRRVGVKLGNRSVTWRFLRDAPLDGPSFTSLETSKLAHAQEAVAEAQTLLGNLRGRRTDRPDVIEELRFAADQLDHALRKARWTVETRDGWTAATDEWLKERLGEVRKLRGEVSGLAKRFSGLWRQRAVLPGLKENLQRYDESTNGLKAAERLLQTAQRSAGKGEAVPPWPEG